ncbi:heat shock protein Hsp18 [Clostridium guangxiense]|uniref:heat shock protein Hsp18 n=1 Tax=Clostridium guangxiense TaxID=1662055 RepID=UPI001E3784A9|nr:heat shock protein Hsp18 [Clostridium guangxiense]MCD2346865.1 Hsp20/alpha crystallin family protein [Clostridium guangxiense]
MFGMVPFRRGTNNIERSGDYFNNIFENFFPDDMFAPVVFKNNNFNVDVKEDENQYTVEADLPGIKKEDITLEYQNNYLTISAKRNNVTEDKTSNYVKKERSYGEFKRTFYIDNVDENSVDASFKDGVLKVSMQKRDKTMNNKKRFDIH